jgi:asparagine synthase (glutamine-hydrolysing)
MCGIAGFIDPALDRDQGDILLDRMLASIRHRGPDNSSTWVEMPVMLGHNRLSIIDLSDAANQPMEYDDLVIVYNGEVYNYVEIKDELIKRGYRFRTTSDTEVILTAYKNGAVSVSSGLSACGPLRFGTKQKESCFAPGIDLESSLSITSIRAISFISVPNTSH